MHLFPCPPSCCLPSWIIHVHSCHTAFLCTPFCWTRQQNEQALCCCNLVPHLLHAVLSSIYRCCCIPPPSLAKLLVLAFIQPMRDAKMQEGRLNANTQESDSIWRHYQLRMAHLDSLAIPSFHLPLAPIAFADKVDSIQLTESFVPGQEESLWTCWVKWHRANICC